MSTLELEYKIKGYTITFKLLYCQADLFFLLENEYEDALNNLNTYTGSDDSYIEILDTYNTLNKIIMNHELTKFLISKKIFSVIETPTTKEATPVIQTIEISKKVSKDKVYDCSKIKKLPSKPTNANSKSKSKSKSKKEATISPKLVLSRIDYTKALIVRFLKRRKDEFICDKIIFENAEKDLKKRFILEKDVFQKSLDALEDDEYIKKDPFESTTYCYLP
jgi:hypothetical protein